MVFPDRDLAHIEWERQSVLRDNYRGIRPQRMADAQLVKRIAVVSGDVRHHHVRLKQLFVHGHVDVARMHYLVCAHAFETRRRGGRLDDVAVGLIEVKRLGFRVVGLRSETHHYEACLVWHLNL